MCGLAGILRPGGITDDDMACLDQMGSRLQHRGPDAHGIWDERSDGIALTHARLSILDLSPAGAQPMLSASGRWVIAYNGEIYNHQAMRKALEEQSLNPEWRGSSDTETLLAAISAWGLKTTLAKARGMYAFACWDREDKSLTLVRDPFGEKPLHIGQLKGGGYVFGSELKAVLAHRDVARSVDRQAVAQILRHGYVRGPLTLFESVSKIEPGSIVTLASGGAHGSTKHDRHFDLLDEARQGSQARFPGTVEEAEGELDRLIQQSVSRQSLSDVPIGAFLSGGIDSATISAVMQTQASRPIKTFTVGFDEPGMNEAPEAAAMAKHLGTDHHEVILEAKTARDLVTNMPDVYDEGFADPSQLPTYLLAQFARKQVTVSLSGDASDELFVGYGRYHAITKRWKGRRALAREAERLYFSAAGTGFAALSALGLDRTNALFRRLEMEKRARHAGASSALEAFEIKFTKLEQAHLLVPGAQPVTDELLMPLQQLDLSPALTCRLLDLARYLPDDILIKVDRAAMAHSLETRIPFLDLDLVRFALSLDASTLMADGARKGLLKRVLARYAPRDLWDRQKRGFGIPLDTWLRQDLAPLAGDLLSRASILRTGVLDPNLVPQVWASFSAGNDRLKDLVWSLLAVQLTLNHWATER